MIWNEIAERERRNAERLQRLRSQWSAKSRAAQELAARIGPPAAPFYAQRRVVLDSPNIRVAYTAGKSVAEVLLFSSDKLTIRRELERFSEQEISRALFTLQNKQRRWPDGTLRGWKKLLRKGNKWVSPQQGTVWENDECRADSFEPDESALRGHSGIHAVWADKTAELNTYPGILVEVSGYGACVVGDIGWRAQFSRVVNKIL